MRRWLALLAVAVLCAGCLDDPQRPASTPPALTSSRPEVVQPNTHTAPAAPLLHAAPNGDGDSWKDTSGKEYRLGLVNTPEYNECYGSEATAERKRLVADGFRAQAYTTDTYGRLVSVVTTADGTNVNVWLARHGFANDKYLQQFRHENPGLAAQLDAAFAAARSEGAGLWSACSADAPRLQQHKTSAPSRGGCDPSYPTVCIPPPPPDLDCKDISFRRFQVLAPDPHHFDADGDGIGCESG